MPGRLRNISRFPSPSSPEPPIISTPGAALLFDINGTLTDTDPLHLKACNRAFAPYEHHFDKGSFAR